MSVTLCASPTPPAIDDVGGVMFDIDGCLMLSDKPGGEDGAALPGARDAIEAMRDSGLPFLAFTNGSSRRPAAIAEELRSAGIDIEPDQVMTPAVVAARVVADAHPGRRVLAFGGDGVLSPLRDAGVTVIDVDDAIAHGPGEVAAVVIGWDTEFGRAKIQAAAEALRSGAALYCTSSAPAFASRGRMNVGVAGFIAAGLEHVSGAASVLVGKPSPAAMDQVARALDLPCDRILVIGDDLTLECSMARRHGAASALVTTGMASRADADKADSSIAPHWVVDSMYDFAELISPALTESRRQRTKG